VGARSKQSAREMLRSRPFIVLDKQDIAEIVARFQQDRLIYERVAGEIHRRAVNLLQGRALKNVVTSRAKSLESLQRTLWRDRSKWTPSSFRDLAPPLVDLAGVRVMLYREEDVEPTRDALLQAFGSPLSQKDKRSRDAYSGLHLVIHNWCHESDLNFGAHRNVPCEIQICTIVEHVWNELEHDIVYKQPSGRPDDAQKELLWSLRAELELASRTALRLMTRTDERARVNNEVLTGAQELRRYLENRLDGRVDGPFEDLFALLSSLVAEITPRGLDHLFEQGQHRPQGEALQARMDVDGAHAQVGLVWCMLVPAFPSADVLDVVGDAPRVAFLRFVRRVAQESLGR
jgi:ppGpp synthetase/RelA/SpoT-type nucleotidyltranferase